MHVLPLHRLVHLSPNTPTSKSTVHHNSANTFRLAHVLQKLFSLFLGISRPCTFSALPFPILVTGEQTGKAIVASHLNGVPLEDLLGAAELQDADPEEDLGRVAYLISIFWRIDYITCYLASSVCFFEGFRAHPHLPVPRLSIDASGTKESIVGINRHRHCLERELLACRPLS